VGNTRRGSTAKTLRPSKARTRSRRGDQISTHQLPVKIVVFNNGALGIIKLEMMVDGLPDYQIDNGSFGYGAIARAAGIHSVRIEEPGEVRDGLRKALARPGPARVDLVTDPNAAMSG
jgi:pyruvate dehydrogenase (quinone)